LKIFNPYIGDNAIITGIFQKTKLLQFFQVLKISLSNPDKQAKVRNFEKQIDRMVCKLNDF